MRLGLVPDSGRCYVVLVGQVTPARAPAQRLDGHAQILFESHRVHDVPAVKAEAGVRLIAAIGADDVRHTGILGRELSVSFCAFVLEVVRTTKVVLGAGSAEGRITLSTVLLYIAVNKPVRQVAIEVEFNFPSPHQPLLFTCHAIYVPT